MDGLDTLRLMILSPALAAAASLVVFTVVTAARRQHWWAAFQHYVKVLKWPVIIGVGSAFVYVIGWTAINKAGNGPLALISRPCRTCSRYCARYRDMAIRVHET
jgi:hypothetical protein